MNPACQTFRHQIYLQVDGELAPAQHADFNAHRDACPPCAQLLQVETDCTTLLRKNLRSGEMPPEASRRLDRAIRWEKGRRTVRAWGIGVAAVLLAGFAVHQSSQWIDSRGATSAVGNPAANPAGIVQTAANRPLKKLVENTTFNGRLVCVSCLLSERHGTHSNCVLDGHRGALLLASGEIIYFTDPSDPRLNKPDSDILDRMVTVEGDYMPREKFIQVKNFQLAES